MSCFDENPADEYEHYPCDKCGNGSIVLNEEKTMWECNVCDFSIENKTKDNNHGNKQ